LKILFLTSRFPYPPHRGDKLKIFNLIKSLSSQHDVHLLSFIQESEEAAFGDKMMNWCASVHVVHLPVWRSLLNCGLQFLSAEPFQVAYFRSSKMRSLLAEQIAEIQPDLIHTHLIRMAPYTMNIQEIPRVLDLTDAVSLYLDRYRSATPSRLRRFLLGIEYSRMVSYEHVISRFDLALVCSLVDRDVLVRNVPEAAIDILQNGIDLGIFSSDETVRQDPNRIIFTGNMSYFPNEDGAQFLVNEILPHIKKQLPLVEVYLVGQSPRDKVKSLSRDGVHVTGFVEDIRLEYLKSAVAVSPVRFGAGTLNKVLEPLALGIPVVSTSIGIQGLDLKPGSDILVADEPEQFANHIVRLLKDPGLRGEMGSAARDKIRSKFEWTEIGRALESYYEQIVSNREKFPNSSTSRSR
jgi:polysaccharide biosynthesis protein PslH